MTNPTPQRLHPLALINEFYHLIREWVIPLIVLLISLTPVLLKAHLTGWLPVAIIAVILAFLIPAGLRYWAFKFALTADSLVIYSGVFNHQINHIPYQRIQSVNQTQWAFLKPFNLITLSVETAGHSGSDRPGAVLAVVNATVYAQLMAAQQAATLATPTAVPQIPTYTINRRDLREFALTSPAFLSAFLVILAGFGKLSESARKALINWVFSSTQHIGLLMIAGLLLATILLFYLGSIATLIMTYYGFTLTRQGDHLIVRRGWFKTRQTEIAIDRIQAIRLKQPLLRHWLHLVTVQLVVISNDHQDDDAANVIIMPVIKQATVNQFLTTFFPQLPPLALARNTDPQTRWWNLRNYGLVGLILCLPISLWWRPWGSLSWLIWGLLIPMGLLRSHASTAQVLTSRYLLMSTSRWFTRNDYLFQRQHIQAFELRQSIWLHKRAYGHIRLHFRAGQHGRSQTVRYLPIAQLQLMRQWYEP